MCHSSNSHGIRVRKGNSMHQVSNPWIWWVRNFYLVIYYWDLTYGDNFDVSPHTPCAPATTQWLPGGFVTYYNGTSYSAYISGALVTLPAAQVLPGLQRTITSLNGSSHPVRAIITSAHLEERDWSHLGVMLWPWVPIPTGIALLGCQHCWPCPYNTEYMQELFSPNTCLLLPHSLWILPQIPRFPLSPSSLLSLKSPVAPVPFFLSCQGQFIVLISDELAV